MKKVLLLSMPMGALERPSLGLSLLKARLDELGVECDVRYLTFAFAEFIGQGNYQWMWYADMALAAAAAFINLPIREARVGRLPMPA